MIGTRIVQVLMVLGTLSLLTFAVRTAIQDRRDERVTKGTRRPH